MTTRAFQSETVQLLVGDPAVDYSVHKDLLCHYSSYFRGAYNSSFQEAESNVFKLDSEDPGIVGKFVHWVYFQTLDEEEEGEQGEQEETLISHDRPVEAAVKKKARAQISGMIQLWLFADRRGVPLLQDMALDTLHDLQITHSRTYSNIISLYDNTCEGSLLRYYFIDVYARSKKQCEDRMRLRQPDVMVPEFLCDVARNLMRLRDAEGAWSSWQSLDPAGYHILESEASTNWKQDPGKRLKTAT